MAQESERQDKVAYPWEPKIVPFLENKEKIKDLRILLNKKIKRGRILKWLIIIADAIVIGLIVLLIGSLNILHRETDSISSTTTGIIAFVLAAITFFSPIETSKITSKDVKRVLETDMEIPTDVMKEIQETVGKGTSGIQKWLAIIGACGVLATLFIL